MSYEFSKEQNELIGGLAGKMSLVGMLGVVIGVMNIISAFGLLVFILQDRMPPDVLEQIPAEVRAELPPRNFLWGILIQGATMGLIFLLIGVWTRSAAASFREIVTTTGRDISHLMEALGSLYKKYALMYTLIVVAALFFVLGLVLQLALRYTG